MTIQRNIVIDGSKEKPILLDLYSHDHKAPLIVFSHGFKGFKDWGHFNLIAESFFKKGFHFCAFNFSHNGTSIEHPTDFVDLNAFGHNNFSIELDDLGLVIDHTLHELAHRVDELFLLGHSRGGGITLLKTAEDSRIRKCATWASVNEYGRFWDEKTMKTWKEAGVLEVMNGRTGQVMPLYYQMYDDYYLNQERLHIPTLTKKISVPGLICHAEDDPTVDVQIAKDLASWNEHFELFITPSGGHTFGGKHPWTEEELPEVCQKVIDQTASFLKE